MTIDIPRFKCFVNKLYLTNQEETGLVEAYCFAITLIESRPLLFTVHTVDGAIYSRLPLNALKWHKTDFKEHPLKHVDPWGAISSNGHAVAHSYLKDYGIKTIFGVGTYMFTIDYFDGGFAEDPEQHKCSHMIQMRDGYFFAFPNNMCWFLDGHFTNPIPGTDYKRNDIYFRL